MQNTKTYRSHDGCIREYNYDTHEWTIMEQKTDYNSKHKNPLAIKGRQFDLRKYFPYLNNKQLMDFDALSHYKSEFKINSNPIYIGHMANNGLNNEIRQGKEQNYGDTGNTLWDTSILFAKTLEYNTFHYLESDTNNNNNSEMNKILNVSNKNVLELGAGMGFVGLCAKYCHAQNVYLTDLKYCLQNMQSNIDKNEYIFNINKNENMNCEMKENTFENVSVFELDWSNPSKSLFEYNKIGKDSVDIIIGSDIIWLKPLVPMLVNTLHYLYENILNKESGFIIIGEQIRSKSVSELFWTLAETKGFHKESVSKQLFHPNFKSDAIFLSVLSKEENV